MYSKISNSQKTHCNYQPKNAMMASNTITNASNFMLSSFVQEIKVLNFSPMAPVLSNIVEASQRKNVDERVSAINYYHRELHKSKNSTIYFVK